MKKLVVLLILCMAFSTANAVIIGVSPASKEVEIFSGKTENVSFAFSTNSSFDFMVTCVTEEGSYLSCPETIDVKGGGITRFNVTATAPIVAESETIKDKFRICYKEEEANVVACVQAEVVMNIQPKTMSNVYIIIALLIVIAIVMVIYDKTHKFSNIKKHPVKKNKK